MWNCKTITVINQQKMWANVQTDYVAEILVPKLCVGLREVFIDFDD